jgi:uncharacterized protein
MSRLTRLPRLGRAGLLGLLVAGALAGCAAAQPAGPAGGRAGPAATPERLLVQAQAGADERAIAVSGQGRVLVTPDLATVVLGVEVRNASLATAQAEAATRANAVIAQLKAAGVAENDIRTVRFSVQPIVRYDEPSRQQIQEGFLVTNLLHVTFRDIAALGARLDQVIQAGATTVQSVQFEVADPAAAVNQARERAVADARARAEHLARLTGVQLGAPLSISESGGPVMPVPQRAAAPTAGVAAPTPIEPGQSEITMSVQIRYALS